MNHTKDYTPRAAHRQPDAAELGRRVPQAMLADQPAFRRRLQGLRRRLKQGKPADRGLTALARDIDDSVARVERRRTARPAVHYPDELPVSQKRDTLAEALERNQVVVVAGETGSGKTTQLPKLCLELGRGVAGLIGHTQPRRIAARSVAERIAAELDTEVGAAVGYKMRFKDRTSPDAYIKLMTDGILLAEIQSDPELRAYDTLIIDEAHERSLNIDFLLGYIKRLLPRRPELRVIITSATIDPERFARHFDEAPVVEVSGRTYPVEIRYRPLDEDQTQADGILAAVDELAAEGPGDVLVFLPGERDIRETAEALRKHHPPRTEILPLFARLSAAEQQRVFQAHGQRRIVLATNVAETSLTVPGIRYVVDTGTARISRYSHRAKVQRLPVEPISQASARQRAGRCGREAPGVCIRLYGEADFEQREPFTPPEILRTSLAAVILQMKTLGLGAIEDFPFVEPPERRMIRDGYQVLEELGALDGTGAPTDVGRQLARLPVDPRLGRMLLAARREGALREALVIVAALSIQDPRERPLEAQQAADEAHARYQHPKSDFLALLNLWEAVQDRQRHLSGNRFRRWCRDQFLNYLRIREWRDIHRQLKEQVTEMGLRLNQEPAGYAELHRVLLTGLLSHIGLRGEAGEYTGARGTKFRIFPGSGVKPAKWLMAAEIVETARFYARTVARIEPDWIEQAGAHLVRRESFGPFWEERAGRVGGYEKVSLFGLVIRAARKIDFGPRDPATARQVFIQEALVRGRYRSRGTFQAANEALIAEVAGLEDKARRRDVLVDEAALYAFYDERLPQGLYDGASFEQWRKQVERDEPGRLHMSHETLMQRRPHEITGAVYPEAIETAGLRLELGYRFEPGHPADGVTVLVPLPALNGLRPEPFQWLVPGLIQEKVEALIRALPKRIRRHAVPVPDFARAFLESVPYREGDLHEQLRGELERMTGARIPSDAWADAALAAHLMMNFRVVDDAGAVVAEGRDLAALQQDAGGVARASFAERAADTLERSGLTRWDFGDLPESVALNSGDGTLTGYPALADEGRSVAIRVVDDPAQAAASHREGVIRLIQLTLRSAFKYLRKELPFTNQHCLAYAAVARQAPPFGAAAEPPDAPCEALRDDLLDAVAGAILPDDEAPPRTQDAFEALTKAYQQEIVPEGQRLARQVGEALLLQHRIRERMAAMPALTLAHAKPDIDTQLAHLLYAGFVRRTPAVRLHEYPRYLKGVEKRLERLASQPLHKDRQRQEQVAIYWQAYLDAAARGDGGPELEPFRWLVEAYRLQVFAQELGTPERVSEKRLKSFIQ